MVVSPRYYVYCFIIVLVVTVVISWVRQTRSRKEFFIIMAQVTGWLAGGIALLFLLVEALVALGIAESGFFL